MSGSAIGIPFLERWRSCDRHKTKPFVRRRTTMSRLNRMLEEAFAGHKATRRNRKAASWRKDRRLTMEHIEPRLMMSGNTPVDPHTGLYVTPSPWARPPARPQHAGRPNHYQRGTVPSPSRPSLPNLALGCKHQVRKGQLHFRLVQPVRGPVAGQQQWSNPQEPGSVTLGPNSAATTTVTLTQVATTSTYLEARCKRPPPE